VKHQRQIQQGDQMTNNNILEQKIIGSIKGEVEDLFKGDDKKIGPPNRIVAGLDAMLGKRADIASRVVAS
jgi:hypothetical protein